MTDTSLNLPNIPTSPMFEGDEKLMTVEWQEFFRSLFDRVGGISGPSLSELDASVVSDLFSTPENANKKINDLEKEIKAAPSSKSYDKDIAELHKFIHLLPYIKSYDKDIAELKLLIATNLLSIREPFKFYLPQITFDDLQVSISNVRVPAANAPTERLNDHGIVGGVTFPSLGFALNDYIYFDVQSYHSMKLSSVLDHHIHYMTPTDGTGDSFKFQLDVIAAYITGNWIVPAGSPFTKEVLMAADLSNSHMIENLADIPASNNTVSTIYKFKLTRIAVVGPASEYAGEVYIEFTDCHYQKDSSGSRNEAAK